MSATVYESRAQRFHRVDPFAKKRQGSNGNNLAKQKF